MDPTPFVEVAFREFMLWKDTKGAFREPFQGDFHDFVEEVIYDKLLDGFMSASTPGEATKVCNNILYQMRDPQKALNRVKAHKEELVENLGLSAGEQPLSFEIIDSLKKDFSK
jgi:hypothetical protein